MLKVKALIMDMLTKVSIMLVYDEISVSVFALIKLYVLTLYILFISGMCNYSKKYDSKVIFGLRANTTI